MDSENRTIETVRGDKPPTQSVNDCDYRIEIPAIWQIQGKSPKMLLVSKEQLESLISAGNPWPLALFTLVGGIASSLLIQLINGVVDASSRHLLWATFYPMVVLTAAFLVYAVREYVKTSKVKRAILSQLPSAQAAPDVTSSHRLDCPSA